MREFFLTASRFKYKYILRPILFKFDSENIHNFFVFLGEKFGKFKITKWFLNLLWGKKYDRLKQEFCGIKFESPIGLSAGFDYDGRLTQILPSLGFGFITIGTITNLPYEGNPKPRLGRLIKSKSLLVNKGFKNSGVDSVLKKLKNASFDIPVGISIGKTNIPEIDTQEKAVKDIVEALYKIEDSDVPFSYYELNISCPNLFGDVTFYLPENLKTLLKALEDLGLSKPLFIKMPIEKSDEETREMLNVIKDFKVDGVIFGNLSKDKNNSSIIKEELLKYNKGNFSGLPTKQRSTELIKLTSKEFPKRFLIIGCGGIFDTEDAKEKMYAGASLVQLITGMIYEGPQLIAEINYELAN